MATQPLISIVTPSYNQGPFIEENIQSVLTQDYKNVEHIIIDGASTDSTMAVVKKYPHLRVVSEKDRGHSDAVNKGFKMAKGQIWGFVNADDTLAPGALSRVAKEIDPARGRHVVMGRCQFTDEAGHFIGVEHPSHFVSHRRMVAVWKGHWVPQPATFWTPEVWERCGPLDVDLHFWIDYDLFCRFSRYYKFHFVDQVLATYRLQQASKTMSKTDADRLEDCIKLSRRYWGCPLKPLYWYLAMSLLCFRFNRRGRAKQFLATALQKWTANKKAPALAHGLAGVGLAPIMATYLLAQKEAPGLAVLLSKMLNSPRRREMIPPQTAVYFDHTNVWDDGWCGPRWSKEIVIEAGMQKLRLSGMVDMTSLGWPINLSVTIDEKPVNRARVEKSGDFSLTFPLPDDLVAGEHHLSVVADNWFVVDRFLANKDHRPLSWRLRRLELV